MPGAAIRDGVLHEVGDRFAEGAPPQRHCEMTLRQLGDTDWPSAGAALPK